MNKLLITSIVSNAFMLVAQLFFLYYISRYMKADIYGTFVLIVTIFSFINLIFIGPLGHASQRFIHIYNKIEFYSLFNALQALVLFISLLVLPVIFHTMLPEYFTFNIVVISMIYVVFHSLTTFFKALDLQKLKNRNFILGTILDSSSKFLFPILFFLIYESVTAMLFGFALGYVISFVIIYYRHENTETKFHFDKTKFKEIFIYAYPFIFTSLGSWSISFSDRWFIEYFHNTSDVGIYAILAQFGGVLLILGGIINTYLMPSVFNKSKISNENAYIEWIKVFKYVFIIFLIILILAFIVPYSFYHFIIGDIVSSKLNFYTFFAIFIGIIFLIFSNIISVMYLVYKKTNELIYFWLIAGIINIIGNLYIKEYGILAAGISTLLAYLTICLILFVRLKVIVKNEQYKRYN